MITMSLNYQIVSFPLHSETADTIFTDLKYTWIQNRLTRNSKCLWDSSFRNSKLVHLTMWCCPRMNLANLLERQIHAWFDDLNYERPSGRIWQPWSIFVLYNLFVENQYMNYRWHLISRISSTIHWRLWMELHEVSDGFANQGHQSRAVQRGIEHRITAQSKAQRNTRKYPQKQKSWSRNQRNICLFTACDNRGSLIGMDVAFLVDESDLVESDLMENVFLLSQSMQHFIHILLEQRNHLDQILHFICRHGCLPDSSKELPPMKTITCIVQWWWRQTWRPSWPMQANMVSCIRALIMSKPRQGIKGNIGTICFQRRLPSCPICWGCSKPIMAICSPFGHISIFCLSSMNVFWDTACHPITLCTWWRWRNQGASSGRHCLSVWRS